MKTVYPGQMRTIKEPNPQQKLLVKHIVFDGMRMKEAEQAAGYKTPAESYRILRKPHVMAYIQRLREIAAFDTVQLNKDRMVDMVRTLYDEAKTDAMRLACLKELNRMLGYYKDTLTLETQGPIFTIQDDTNDKTDQETD